MIHEIKLSEEFCKSVENGDKTFEVRLNDRNYCVGDFVKFIPWNQIDNKKSDLFQNLEKIDYKITYVLRGWGIKDEWVVFSFEPLTNIRLKYWSSFFNKHPDAFVELVFNTKLSVFQKLILRFMHK